VVILIFYVLHKRLKVFQFFIHFLEKSGTKSINNNKNIAKNKKHKNLKFIFYFAPLFPKVDLVHHLTYSNHLFYRGAKLTYDFV